MSDSSIERKRVEVLIVGAGPTGLGAAKRLTQAQHDDWLLIDKFHEPSGLARTDVTPEGFLFDVGGHVIFSHYEYFDKLLQEALGNFTDESAWLTHQREAYVRYKGIWVPYPFQNNLCRIPVDDQVKAILGMVNAKVEDAKAGPDRPRPANFDEWIVRTMGEGIADIFMRPYNFKVWAIPPDKMQCEWLGERVAVVDANRAITNVLLNKEDVGWGPNATFRFPVRGGTASIWKGVAKLLPQERLEFNRELISLDLEKKEAVVKTHESKTTIYEYQHMVSTIPLDLLLSRITNGIDQTIVNDCQNQLIHSSTHVVGIGIRGIQPHGRFYWLYFPEDNCPFYRACVFSNFSPNNVPPSEVKLPTLRLAGSPESLKHNNGVQPPQSGPYWSLMLEVSENNDFKPVDVSTVVEECIQGCIRAGLLQPDHEIVSLHWNRFEHGYPTPSLQRDEALKVVLPFLESCGVYSRGRFGSYKYEVANQDHSVALGVEAIDHILFGLDETTLHVPGYVNRNVGSQINLKPSWKSRKFQRPGWFVVAGDKFPTSVAWLRNKIFPSIEEFFHFVSTTQQSIPST